MFRYNADDLKVRKVVAAHGLTLMAANLATDTRRGSADTIKQKQLEIGIAQFDCLKNYKALQYQAIAIFKPIENTGSQTTNTITVNGVVISNTFTIPAGVNAQQAQVIADAINAIDSTPNYTASVVQDEVHVIATEFGASTNNYDIGYTTPSANLISSSTDFYGGQDGVTEEDNIIDEVTLEKLFNNISEITGCGYAPLGTKYE